MAKNNLLVINGTETTITNSDLFKSVKTIISAEGMEKASAWVIAKEYTNIIQNELYEDDFESEKDFAISMGKSPALISQYKKACNFITSIEGLLEYNLNANTITVGKAYILSCVDNVVDFIEWCNAENICIESLTDRGLKDVVRQWKYIIDVDAVETEEVETVENTEVVEDESLLDEVISYISGMSDELEKVLEFVKGLGA